ncbi:MAG: toxin-antitoxin system TumE family protein, partial [bacterium]
AFSGTLRLHLYWPLQNKKFSIRETYTFPRNQLRINSYSYALIETGDRVIIRADSAPHHERDYHRKLLNKFPHHLHDEKGRICSFNGNIEGFIKLAAPYFV